MASQTIDVNFGRLDGFFKDRYAEKLANNIPDFALLQQAGFSPFVSMAKETLGNYYKQAIVSKRPQGFTHNLDGSIFALNNARGMKTVGAQIRGTEIALEERFSIASLTRAQQSESAFGETFSEAVKAMDLAAKHRLESELLYGSASIGQSPASGGTYAGTVTAISGSVYQGVDVSDTANTYYCDFYIDVKYWAAGIWQPAIGAGIDAYTALTSGSQVGGQTFDLIGYDTDAKKITLAGTQTNLGTLRTAINTPTVTYFFWQGAYAKEMVGLSNIASTTTGSLFNVGTDANPVFKGNVYDAGAASLTVGKILTASAKLANRGLNEDSYLLCNPFVWQQLAQDTNLIGARRFTSADGGKLAQGAEALEIHSNIGTIAVIPHPMIKNAEAYILPRKNAIKRIGSTEITFKNPASDDKYFYEIPGYMGSALRAYTDQALYTDRPGHILQIQNISTTGA